MALIPTSQFPGQIDPADPEYPLGKARDVVTSGDNTGTPWVKELINDLFGFQQAVITKSGQTPSGAPETALSSQYLQGLLALSSEKVSDVSAVSGIDKGDTVDGAAFSLLEWHAGSNLGGALYRYDKTRPVADHDGGVVLSLTMPWGGSTDDYLNKVGETAPGGQGCLVLCDQRSVSFLNYGARPNTPSHNDTQSIINTFAAGLTVFEETQGTFTFNNGSGVQLTKPFIAYGVTIEYTGDTNGLIPFADDVSILGVTLKDVTGNITDGILPPLTPVNNLVIKDVTIAGMQRYGIRCNFDFTKLTLENVRIEDHGRAGISDSTGVSIHPPTPSTGLAMSGVDVVLRDPSGGRSAVFRNCGGTVSATTFKRGAGGLVTESVVLGDATAGVTNMALRDITIEDETPGDFSTKIKSVNLDIKGLTTVGVNRGLEFDDNSSFKLTYSDVGQFRSTGHITLNGFEVRNCKIQGVYWGNRAAATILVAQATGLRIHGNEFSEVVQIRSDGTDGIAYVTHNKIDAGDQNEFELKDVYCTHNDFVATADAGIGLATASFYRTDGNVVFTSNTVEGYNFNAWGVVTDCSTGRINMNSVQTAFLSPITILGGSGVVKQNNDENGTFV